MAKFLCAYSRVPDDRGRLTPLSPRGWDLDGRADAEAPPPRDVVCGSKVTPVRAPRRAR